MRESNTENRWLRRFAAGVAVCALLLVIAGGLVTSNDAAMSIPDWPLSYGKLVPPLEGGIRFEFAHRALAATVAVLTLVLAVWLARTEPRRWIRSLGWLAVAAVVAQAVLGGAVVRFVTPKPLAILHACFAQVCFGLLVAVAVALQWRGRPVFGAGEARLPLLAAAALFAQTIGDALWRVEHGRLGVGLACEPLRQQER